MNKLIEKKEFESCDKCQHSAKGFTEHPCNTCTHNAIDHYKPMTNADYIRNMTDEEMAEFLNDLTDNCCRCAEHQNCGNCYIGLDKESGFCDIGKWLKAEREG